MRPGSDLTRTAALIADPSRAAMLDRLMDGSACPIGDLAREAGVSLSTASEHVTRLERGGLVATERVGRRRLVRLHDASVARILESLANLAGRSGVPGPSTAMARLRSARTCYDHLAGRLGVGLADALVERGALVPGDEAFALSARGRAWFTSIGVDLDELTGDRRPVARACLDWTERRPHLAGGLGAALARRALERGWVVRLASSRALLITPEGRAFLEGAFGANAAWAGPGHQPQAAPRGGADATIPGHSGFRESRDRSTRLERSAVR